jgi:hypothetical protein
VREAFELAGKVLIERRQGRAPDQADHVRHIRRFDPVAAMIGISRSRPVRRGSIPYYGEAPPAAEPRGIATIENITECPLRLS